MSTKWIQVYVGAEPLASILLTKLEAVGLHPVSTSRSAAVYGGDKSFSQILVHPAEAEAALACIDEKERAPED
jgi:hypothetical protein